MIKVIIIDDEEPARHLIKFYLKDFQEIQVVEECRNGFDGLKAVQEHQPDLIFLDIKMPKISGFEMLELLEKPPLTIFSTAYDDMAIRAFELNAIDYLLKPYTKERFIQAVEKALDKLNKGENPLIANEPLELKISDAYLDRIVVKNGSKIEIIPIGDIHYIEAQDDYVKIHSSKGKYLKQGTMKSYEEQLPPSLFLRIHRSFIVKLDMISSIEPYTKDSYLTVLKSGDQLSVSKAGYQMLKSHLRI